MQKIITICGPTGVGKTSFSIDLAKKFSGEIIGADSMQIYKFMDIGTAKPTRAEQKEIPHHLIDFLEPSTDFDAGKYAQMASAVINDLSQKNKTPIVAGGTGLYIRSLIFGLFRSRPICKQTMEGLTREAEKHGPFYLHERLTACDPESAKKIHPNDTFRIVRALEVFESTGSLISSSQNGHGFREPKFNSLTLGLSMDRDLLYERINQRVDMMMDQGFLREVEKLLDSGYGLHLKSMKSIGYRHMGLYLTGKLSFDEAMRLFKRDTRRYAKRQFTWFRKEPGIIWTTPDALESTADLVNIFLTSQEISHIVRKQFQQYPPEKKSP